MSKRLVLASNNVKKAAEMQALLAPLGIEVIPQSVFGVGEAEEPHPSFVENALAKARHASAATGLPAVADDSGLCVEALGGAPGVISARFAGEPKSDARNNALLLRRPDDPGLQRLTPWRPFAERLHAADELLYAEIAERLGVSPSRVRQYLAQGLRQCYVALYGAPQ